jgi:hypothetical protein
MPAKFSFQIDRPRGLVRITMAGFYTQENIRAFVAARREAHEALGCAPNSHLTLNDIRGMTAQPHSTVDAFGEMLAAPEYRSRRLAFVVGPYLARTQVLRALANRACKCFTDPVAAEEWLLAGDEEIAPLRRAAG